ncbi:hypothetical protein VTK73DRAFT_9225 [Phialemonium thermophilum]|uniref:Uncharacterized protein n=1 Tax=Phialemonium thermophilum TaxID=223376 RepID=A0ABR3W3L2_9PEZI
MALTPSHGAVALGPAAVRYVSAVPPNQDRPPKTAEWGSVSGRQIGQTSSFLRQDADSSSGGRSKSVLLWLPSRLEIRQGGPIQLPSLGSFAQGVTCLILRVCFLILSRPVSLALPFHVPCPCPFTCHTQFPSPSEARDTRGAKKSTSRRTRSSVVHHLVHDISVPLAIVLVNALLGIVFSSHKPVVLDFWKNARVV